MDEEQDETSHWSRETYAHFGLAYYLSECVFEGLVHVLATDGISVTRGAIEERTKRFARMTLGPLVAAAKGSIPSEFHNDLDRMVERRNDLAHGYWFKHVHEMGTIDGCRALVADLKRDQVLFRALSQMTDDVTVTRGPMAQLTKEDWDRAMDEARSGPPEPVLERDLLKPGAPIQLLKAWAIPPAASLVLEDVAGELWQFSERGLGWFVGARVPEWKASRLQKFLPATVIQPKGVEPWTYALEFSTGLRIDVAMDANTSLPRMTTTP